MGIRRTAPEGLWCSGHQDFHPREQFHRSAERGWQRYCREYVRKYGQRRKVAVSGEDLLISGDSDGPGSQFFLPDVKSTPEEQEAFVGQCLFVVFFDERGIFRHRRSSRPCSGELHLVWRDLYDIEEYRCLKCDDSVFIAALMSFRMHKEHLRERGFPNKPSEELSGASAENAFARLHVS